MSGWCTTCGRRRGADGRCINCDPWWTSPLIQVGGPALAICCVFLVGIVAALTPPKPDPALGSSHHGGSSSTPTVFSSPALSSGFVPPVGPLSAPRMAQAPPPLAAMPQLPASFFAPPPPPDAQQQAEFEQLRYQVRLASIQMRSRNEALTRYEPTFVPAGSPAKGQPGALSLSPSQSL
ncbi:hypothetical protein [Armatimonas rosea]|uniref:Uncharacterized protein n=1 Tax=Armatimonas rosea TaxID=685828 RepID=A0A7W9SRH6_ARMRO|nr:hypothetical protein [Armatimonas rosea]MBB6050654.1 hypothetical protein [Armatimonas rosea]